jgi:hypothetical protein
MTLIQETTMGYWPPPIKWAMLGLALGCVCFSLRAQELSGLAGLMRPDQGGKTTYSFQVDYRQEFYRNFAASADYINAGHVPGHHLDGEGLEI